MILLNICNKSFILMLIKCRLEKFIWKTVEITSLYYQLNAFNDCAGISVHLPINYRLDWFTSVMEDLISEHQCGLDRYVLLFQGGCVRFCTYFMKLVIRDFWNILRYCIIKDYCHIIGEKQHYYFNLVYWMLITFWIKFGRISVGVSWKPLKMSLNPTQSASYRQ